MGDTEKGGAGFGMIFLIAGIFELDLFKQDPSREPGNFGDPLGWTRMDGNVNDFWTYDTEMRNKELAHCRLAMSGIITCFLLEYGGIDTSAQFAAGPLPGWAKFAFPVFTGLLLCVGNSKQFYVTDDSSALRPAYLGAGAALPAAMPGATPVPAIAAPAAVAAFQSAVLEKAGGRFRFKE